MSKKKVTAPLSYSPGGGHPKEYLAYLNWREMETLKRLHGSGPVKGPRGIPSFIETSGQTFAGDMSDSYTGTSTGNWNTSTANYGTDTSSWSSDGGGSSYTGGSDVGSVQSSSDVGGIQSSVSSPAATAPTAPAGGQNPVDAAVQQEAAYKDAVVASRQQALSQDIANGGISAINVGPMNVPVKIGGGQIAGTISKIAEGTYAPVTPTSPGAGGGFGSLDTRRSSLLSPVGPSSGIEALGNIGPTRMPTSLASKIQDRLPSYATPVSPLEREPRVMPPPSPTWTPNVMTSDPFGESFGRRMRDVTAQDVFIGGGLLPTVNPYTPTTIPQSVTPDLRISPASGQPYGMRSPLSRATGQPYGMKIIGDIPAPPIMTAGEVGMSFRGFAPSELAAKSADVRKDIGEILRDGSRLGSLADGTKLSVGIGPPPDTTLSGPLSPAGLPANTLRPEPSLYRPDSIGTIKQAIGSAYKAIGDYFSPPEQPVSSKEIQDRILGSPEDEKAFLTTSEIRDGVPTYFKSPGGLLAYPGLDKGLAPDLPKQAGQEKILGIEDVPPAPEGGIVDLGRPQKFTSYPRPNVVASMTPEEIKKENIMRSGIQQHYELANYETMPKMAYDTSERDVERLNEVFGGYEPSIQPAEVDVPYYERVPTKEGLFSSTYDVPYPTDEYGVPVQDVSEEDIAKITARRRGEEYALTPKQKTSTVVGGLIERAFKTAANAFIPGSGYVLGKIFNTEDKMRDYLSRPSWEQRYIAERARDSAVARGDDVGPGAMQGGIGSIYTGGQPTRDLGGKNPWWEEQYYTRSSPYSPSTSRSTTGSDSAGADTPLKKLYRQWDKGIGIPSRGDPLYNEYQKYLKTRDQEGTA